MAQNSQQDGFSCMMVIDNAVIPVVAKAKITQEADSYTYKRYQGRGKVTFHDYAEQILNITYRDTHPLLEAIIHDATLETGGSAFVKGESHAVTVNDQVILDATPDAGSEVLTIRAADIESGMIEKIFTRVTTGPAVDEYTIANGTCSFGAGSVYNGTDTVFADYTLDGTTGYSITFEPLPPTNTRKIVLYTGYLDSINNEFVPDGGTVTIEKATRRAPQDIPIGGSDPPEDMTLTFSCLTPPVKWKKNK